MAISVFETNSVYSQVISIKNEGVTGNIIIVVVPACEMRLHILFPQHVLETEIAQLVEYWTCDNWKAYVELFP